MYDKLQMGGGGNPHFFPHLDVYVYSDKDRIFFSSKFPFCEKAASPPPPGLQSSSISPQPSTALDIIYLISCYMSTNAYISLRSVYL